MKEVGVGVEGNKPIWLEYGHRRVVLSIPKRWRTKAVLLIGQPARAWYWLELEGNLLAEVYQEEVCWFLARVGD